MKWFWHKIISNIEIDWMFQLKSICIFLSIRLIDFMAPVNEVVYTFEPALHFLLISFYLWYTGKKIYDSYNNKKPE